MSELDPMVDIPFEVLAHEHGWRADLFLCRRLKRMSRTRAADIIREGNVRKAGGAVLEKPATRVYEGERLILKRRKLVEAPTDDLIIPVLHQDERIVAVCKPGNLVVHPTASAYHRTLIRIMRTRLSTESLDLCHRIDKETSGLVLMAKDQAAAIEMNEQFARRTVRKSYLAIVDGVPQADTFQLDAPMRLVPNSESGVIMEIGGEGAQHALTEVHVLARGPAASLVEARPKTGRQHQIRLHLAHAGHPIVGDKLYLGGETFFIEALQPEVAPSRVIEAVGHERQALHAWKATFRHPEGDEMTLAAPLATDMVALAESLEIQLPAAVLGSS